MLIFMIDALAGQETFLLIYQNFPDGLYLVIILRKNLQILQLCLYYCDLYRRKTVIFPSVFLSLIENKAWISIK